MVGLLISGNLLVNFYWLIHKLICNVEGRSKPCAVCVPLSELQSLKSLHVTHTYTINLKFKKLAPRRPIWLRYTAMIATSHWRNDVSRSFLINTEIIIETRPTEFSSTDSIENWNTESYSRLQNLKCRFAVMKNQNWTLFQKKALQIRRETRLV